MNNTKIKLFVSAGISSNLFLAQRTKVSQKFDGGSIESSSSKTMGGYNVVNFAILAGIGMDYDLNDKIKFRIEPIYRRSLNSIVNAPIKGYLYSAGLNIGVYINI
jgi:opacity protein-like surface antigen